MSRYKEFDEYEELIKERLSKKRFTHSMNVAEACYDLAERFGADKKRCYLAGLLHDIMKEDLPDRQRQMTAECPRILRRSTLRRCGMRWRARRTSGTGSG